MSYESAVGWLWSVVENAPEINELLARSTVEGQEKRPAIYDTNPAQEPLFPYVLITVDPTAGSLHWGQAVATVSFDIYDNSHSSIPTVALMELIESALSFNRNLSEDNLYLCYPNGDALSLPEEDPAVSHISFTMQLKYWRNDLIDAVQ